MKFAYLKSFSEIKSQQEQQNLMGSNREPVVLQRVEGGDIPNHDQIINNLLTLHSSCHCFNIKWANFSADTQADTPCG